MAFRNQVSSFFQSIPDDLWQIHPMNQLAWLKYFKDLKPDHSPRHDLAEIAALCLVYLPDGIDPDQGLPLEPFLTRVLSMDANPSWVRTCCFLLLNMYAMKNRQPGIGDFRLLTIVRNMQRYFPSCHQLQCSPSCPMLLQAWALDKLSLIPPVPARLIPTYGPANFRPLSRGQFDFGDNPVIRWTCRWWRIRLVTTGSMNLSYVLYASLDRSMAYFPDRINRQYGVVQRIPRIHDFESGLMTQSLLTNLADRWQNRNTWYMGQGVIQDTVTPEYVDWFYSQ
ncbi:hypothetical protein JCGZ_19119 [Jatropha curcas]|uniref:Aminotransferase-like plant mobile domain-containing protein n=1 Tax=Jatropha curcas TaxID=180498 RepID=A0A067K1F2_JATCU|nr:hypothetical protein JCGZ_19119 [Jatropha curcas]